MVYLTDVEYVVGNIMERYIGRIILSNPTIIADEMKAGGWKSYILDEDNAKLLSSLFAVKIEANPEIININKIPDSYDHIVVYANIDKKTKQVKFTIPIPRLYSEKD